MPNENSAALDTRDRTRAHDGPRDESPGRATAEHAEAQSDPVETALVEALRKAATEGRFDPVASVTAELKARRELRANVVDIRDARAHREGKGDALRVCGTTWTGDRHGPPRL